MKKIVLAVVLALAVTPVAAKKLDWRWPDGKVQKVPYLPWRSTFFPPYNYQDVCKFPYDAGPVSAPFTLPEERCY